MNKLADRLNRLSVSATLAMSQKSQELKAQGVDFKNLRLSPLATITMPYHIEVDGWSEANSGKGKIGTTKRGIGPTYTDKMARIAFKIQDLYSLDALNEKIDMVLPLKNKTLEKVYGLEPYTKECILSLCEKYAELFNISCHSKQTYGLNNSAYFSHKDKIHSFV